MAERVDVGALRRAQIVEAAMRVIARKGFHNATLAEVEAEAGISRGMMTYHFPSKDAMIGGVFEALLDRLRESMPPTGPGSRGLDRIDRIIDATIGHRPTSVDFLGIHHAFLAQVSHRDDYRAGLAGVYAVIREAIAGEFLEAGHADDQARELAAVLVASLHGLAVQREADPAGFDPAPLAARLKSLVRADVAAHPEVGSS